VSVKLDYDSRLLRLSGTGQVDLNVRITPPAAPELEPDAAAEEGGIGDEPRLE
jgi:hypothetical protein